MKKAKQKIKKSFKQKPTLAKLSAEHIRIRQHLFKLQRTQTTFLGNVVRAYSDMEGLVKASSQHPSRTKERLNVHSNQLSSIERRVTDMHSDLGDVHIRLLNLAKAFEAIQTRLLSLRV